MRFTEIASHFNEVLKSARSMRDDLNVICMFHDEFEAPNEDGVVKRVIKTSSKFIKEKLKPEGLFTYVLFTDVFVSPEDDAVHYTFLTNDGITTSAKTPHGCFEDKNIPNDLSLVIAKINEYNEG